MPGLQPTHVTKFCQHCSVAFQAPVTIIGRTPMRFCSVVCRYASRHKPLVDRFFNHIGRKTENGCILFAGKKHTEGYGILKADVSTGKEVYAHRASYELMVGPIPAGLCVLHRCDNPPCINPVHLFVGTKQDNTDDMVAKGRHSTLKLDEYKAREIKRRLASKESCITIAASFGVTVATIVAIRKGVTWRHVT